MSSSLTKFLIVLERPDSVFKPGQVICGLILVHLSRIKSVRGLKMSVKGLAEVGWSQSRGIPTQVISYLNKEEYFKHEFYLLGRADNVENAEMQPGEHAFLFNFTLPNNIPSSFEHKNGKISYSVKAVLERPWKFDHQVEIPIRVETPFDLGIYPPAMNVIDDVDYKSFCCFSCFRMGSMKIHIYVHTSGFSVDENIQVRIDMSNNSRVIDVTKIELHLQKIIHVIGYPTGNKLSKKCNQAHVKRSTEIVQKVDKRGPFDKFSEMVMAIKVPKVPSSNLVHCNIISLLYRLNIVISLSGCQGALKKSYPIVIGTKDMWTLEPIQDQEDSDYE